MSQKLKENIFVFFALLCVCDSALSGQMFLACFSDEIRFLSDQPV